MAKIIVGLVEKVKINGQEILAKVDTGAENNSMDTDLAEKLRLGPPIKTSKIRSAHGKTIRPVVEANLNIKGKEFKTTFNIINRSHMKYKVLIGTKILKQGFLVDTSK